MWLFSVFSAVVPCVAESGRDRLWGPSLPVLAALAQQFVGGIPTPVVWLVSLYPLSPVVSSHSTASVCATLIHRLIHRASVTGMSCSSPVCTCWQSIPRRCRRPSSATRHFCSSLTSSAPASQLTRDDKTVLG